MSEETNTEQAGSSEPERTKVGRRSTFRTRMIAGVTIIAPLWITGFVLWTMINWADRISRPLIRPFAIILGHPDWYYFGVGFAITMIIIWLVGTVATNVLGRRLVAEARNALERLPVVRTIYAPVRQLMETMTSPDTAGFRKVVLFEYPRRGLWTLGFLAGDVPMQEEGPSAHSIFVPTAPNPTTGFMLIIPRHEMRHTSLTIEEAFQMIVSAGVAVPLSLRLPPGVADSSDTAIEVGVFRSSTSGAQQVATTDIVDAPRSVEADRKSGVAETGSLRRGR